METAPLGGRTELIARPPQLVVKPESPLSGFAERIRPCWSLWCKVKLPSPNRPHKSQSWAFLVPSEVPGSVSQGLIQERGRHVTIAK